MAALVRAAMDRPASPEGDPGVQAALCREMAPAPTGLQGQLVARTRFFDAVVLEALDAGVAQIVVCGAGYDDRALRFRTPGVRFFELDLPSTQTHKRRLLAGAGIDDSTVRYLPADFRTDDVGATLAAGGHDPRTASLFLCEGLLVYLSEQTGTGLLRTLRSRAAPGSRLVASLAVHRADVSTDEARSIANARRVHGRGERWRTILPLDAHLALVESAGWRIERPVDAAELDPGVAPGRSYLVIAGVRPR